jgi:hypothetical protein
MIALRERIDELEPDENPADVFPCMNAMGIHTEARAQLYTVVMQCFLDEAMGFEPIIHSLGMSGPNILQLELPLMDKLAGKDENDIEELVSHWIECEAVEELELDSEDLNDFLFQLVHFCQTAKQGELGVYIYSDG